MINMFGRHRNIQMHLTRKTANGFKDPWHASILGGLKERYGKEFVEKVSVVNDGLCGFFGR